MNFLRPFPLAILLGMAAAVPARAQGAVHGRVVNAASHAPVANATIEALASGRSVARDASGDDGAFRLTALRPGRYRVRIRALGYTPRELPAVVVAPDSADVDVGDIALTPAVLQLQALVIRDEQRDVQLAPDRNTYVVRDMPTTRGGNALDVLRNVPSVDVDIDNAVSLRGNSGVVVQINGRPSPMKSAQLGNFLSQLPAEMVDKVEIVPNPSARDDPEGAAGIINIVMKKHVDAGTTGGLTLSGGTTGRANVGGSLGYQRGPLSLYGSYGFMRDSRARREVLYRENRYLDPVTYLEESGERESMPRAHTFTGSATWTLGEHDELSSDLLFGAQSEDATSSTLYRDLDPSRELAGLSDRTSGRTGHERELESTLGYSHAFAGAGHKLKSELRLYRGSEGGSSSLAARALALDGTPQRTTALEQQAGWEHPDERSLKVDYTRPLSSFVRLEAGYKGSLEGFRTALDTRAFDTTSAAWGSDTARISDFTYDQTVHAAYGMLDAQLGEFLLQGGLRVERATTRFQLNLRGQSYDNSYNSVFPSALVAWNIDDSHEVKLSYSTRIRRPDDTDELDPTLRYDDPLNVSRGNPYLQPEYVRALELGLQRTTDRLTVQVTPFFRHTFDDVRSLRSIDSAGVAMRTWANIATSDSYGTDVTVALHGKRLSGFAGVNLSGRTSNASELAPELSARSFGWSARTNTSLRISKSFDVQAMLHYRAPRTVDQGWSAGRTRVNFAARKKLLDDQLNLTLRVSDPFNMSGDRSTTTDPRFFQLSNRSREDRGVRLSVSWSFGTPVDEEEEQ